MLKVRGDGKIATTNGLCLGDLVRRLGNRKSLWLTADNYGRFRWSQVLIIGLLTKEFRA